MEAYKITTPEGTHDRLFSESLGRRRTAMAICAVFEKRGYKEVITPETEYFDLFKKAENPIPRENLIKLVGRDGQLLVMRPDCTTPIARIAATRLKNSAFPHRIYYNQTIFRANMPETGGGSELAQCGIELLGAPGIRSDIEAVVSAVDALKAAGAVNFHIELGHVNFFEGLADELTLNESVRSEIKRYMESKDLAGLDKVTASIPGGDALKKLPYLFGSCDVLSEAAELTSNPNALSAIAYLERIFKELRAAGRGEHIRFDLGLTQSLNYYSGLVFRGYAAGAGRVVLAGGRYDNLVGDFGLDLPATGFAVYLDALLGCLAKTDVPVIDFVVHYEDGYLDSALKLLDTLPHGTAELSPYEGIDDSIKAARLKGARCVFSASSGGVAELEVSNDANS